MTELQNGLISLSEEKLLPIIRETLDCGGKFVLTVTGNSMAPTLHHLKDKVELVSPLVRPVARGEIVLFQRLTGECILHRVLDAKGQWLQINGDAQTWTELATSEQVLGVVSRFQREGRWHSCDSGMYHAYVAVWRMLRPFRPMLFRLKGLFSR